MLGLNKAQVGAVATFYTMYKRRPTGDYLVSVCTNTMCNVLGGQQVYDTLAEHLGVGHDETTADGTITLEHAECLAACDYGPVMTVNYEFFDRVDAADRARLVDELRAASGRCRPGAPGSARSRRWRSSSPASPTRARRGRRRPGRASPRCAATAWPSSTASRCRLRPEHPDHARRARSRPGTKAGPPPSPPGRKPGGRRRPRKDGQVRRRPKLTPVLTKRWLSPDAWRLDVTSGSTATAALRKALAAHPDDLIQLVKDSGLRGRGGAGFPTGMKWGFIPQNDGKPHYLVVNADEGEPGTCKDLPLMMHDPHSLIEGVIIASYAIRADRAYIYIRGEAVHAARRLRNAVDEAYAKGYLGRNILGSGFDLDAGGAQWRRGVHLRRGDGAAGLAGGLPRPAPAAPAVPGHPRPLRLPDRGQQRRDHRQRAVHRARRRRLVEDHGHGEVVRPDDLLALRPDRQPRPVRVLAWASPCAS